MHDFVLQYVNALETRGERPSTVEREEREGRGAADVGRSKLAKK